MKSDTKQLTSEEIRQIIDEILTALAKLKLPETDSEDYINNVTEILDDYRERLGDESEIRYRVKKRMDRVEIRFAVKGEKHDPFEEGAGSEERRVKKTVNSVLFNADFEVTYRYAAGYNIVTVRSARKKSRGNAFRQPMIQAAVAGLIAGYLCTLLPETANSFIVNEITQPVLQVSLDVMSGILGPIVFLSIVRAVSALDGIDELTGLGSKVLKRFLIVTIYISLLSNVIGMLFFPGFGKGTITFNPGTLIKRILEIIPTSLLTPFVENNIPQLVILGIGMGAALLVLGDKVKNFTEILSQLFEWLTGFMKTIMVILPVVPFLSVFNIVARGEAAIFLKGWRYIVAIYVCMAFCMLAKLFKVSRKCDVSVKLLWQKIKPVVAKVFSTGSVSGLNYEVAKSDLGIDPEFSVFWIPLSDGMLDPTSTMSFVLAPFLVANITGTPVSISFMFILMLLAVELSMASPGLTAGYTVIFQSLGMSAEYVGMFSAFSVVIKDCASACSAAYRLLEHVDVAYKTDNIDVEILRAPCAKAQDQAENSVS